MNKTIEVKQRMLIVAGNYKIKGDLGIFSDIRLTDYMNETNVFIALTNAVVTDFADKTLFTTDLLNIRKHSIDMIAPMDVVHVP